jgi:hypothetical protein
MAKCDWPKGEEILSTVNDRVNGCVPTAMRVWRLECGQAGVYQHALATGLRLGPQKWLIITSTFFKQ